jgi:hypothetical protein
MVRNYCEARGSPPTGVSKHLVCQRGRPKVNKGLCVTPESQRDSLSVLCARRRRPIDVILTDVSQIVLPTRVRERTLYYVLCDGISPSCSQNFIRFITHKSSRPICRCSNRQHHMSLFVGTRRSVPDGQRHISHSGRQAHSFASSSENLCKISKLTLPSMPSAALNVRASSA